MGLVAGPISPINGSGSYCVPILTYIGPLLFRRENSVLKLLVARVVVLRSRFVALSIGFVLACLVTATTFGQAPATLPAKQLHALIDAEWEQTLRDAPTFATDLGDARFNDRWPDLSIKAFEHRHAHRQEVLKQLAAMPVEQLSPADRINFELFRGEYEIEVEAFPFGWHLIPLNQREGIQDANSVADTINFATVKDYEDWLARLRSFPTYMDQTIALMQEGTRENPDAGL